MESTAVRVNLIAWNSVAACILCNHFWVANTKADILRKQLSIFVSGMTWQNSNIWRYVSRSHWDCIVRWDLFNVKLSVRLQSTASRCLLGHWSTYRFTTSTTILSSGKIQWWAVNAYAGWIDALQTHSLWSTGMLMFRPKYRPTCVILSVARQTQNWNVTTITFTVIGA
jgi:hypothetical protein